MIVGVRQRQDLAYSLAGQGFGAGTSKRGRVGHSAHAHDQTLAGHKARHRVKGADHAGVGQGGGGVLEVIYS